mmetsp:Transcript_24688/g.67271  ORF Transcript_24688/g.67271 Transcript_24688/m.67271 type:complete len:250 (-) Transcript_24688:2213-2962(-)
MHDCLMEASRGRLVACVAETLLRPLGSRLWPGAGTLPMQVPLCFCPACTLALSLQTLQVLSSCSIACFPCKVSRSAVEAVEGIHTGVAFLHQHLHRCNVAFSCSKMQWGAAIKITPRCLHTNLEKGTQLLQVPGYHSLREDACCHIFVHAKFGIISLEHINDLRVAHAHSFVHSCYSKRVLLIRRCSCFQQVPDHRCIVLMCSHHERCPPVIVHTARGHSQSNQLFHFCNVCLCSGCNDFVHILLFLSP